MTWFYIRWASLVAMALIFSGITFQHYQRNLASITPERIVSSSHPTSKNVRLEGMVQSGTLTGNLEAGEAEFTLVGETAQVPVQYHGSPPENLRELKTLIVIGQWSPQEKIFQANEIDLVTNFNFVISAYLIGILPLLLIVFSMSRKVTSLFQVIKESKLYEPQAEFHVD